MPAGWIAAAGVIGGALISSNASSNAAQTQANAANNATNVQEAQNTATQANVAPWLQAGQGSLAQQVAGTQPGGALNQNQYTPFTQAQFQQDPGYQFQLQQGENALTNQSSIAGGPNSNNMKGLMGFSQGLASNDYQTALNNYMQQFQLANSAKQGQFNNLQTLSQGGLGAGLGQGQIGANSAQSIGQNIIGAGNAQAAGQVGVGNAINSGIGSAYNGYLQQQFLAGMGNQSPIYGGASAFGSSNTSPLFGDVQT